MVAMTVVKSGLTDRIGCVPDVILPVIFPPDIVLFPVTQFSAVLCEWKM